MPRTSCSWQGKQSNTAFSPCVMYLHTQRQTPGYVTLLLRFWCMTFNAVHRALRIGSSQLYTLKNDG